MLPEINPETIQDLEGARQAILGLLNLVEELKEENRVLILAATPSGPSIGRPGNAKGPERILVPALSTPGHGHAARNNDGLATLSN